MNKRHDKLPQVSVMNITHRTRRKHYWFIAYVCLLLAATLALPLSAKASVTAQVDRNTVGDGDTFTLTLNVSGDNHAQPDLSVLQNNFQVMGTGQKSMIQIINGSISSSRSWTITLTPRHTGKLTIPPITVGNSRSNPITITVLPGTASSGGSAHGAVFLNVSVKPQKSTYVQAQLLYTVRLYYAVALQQGTLSDPKLDNAIVQKLGHDSDYETMRNGREYQVVERHYAIFPQQSGELKIPPIVFDGQVNAPSSQTGNSFFNNFGFNFNFNPVTRHVRLLSRSIDIKVLNKPTSYTGSNWLPAKQLELQEKWSPVNPNFRVGNPVTRSIIIHAQGLSSSQLPNLPIQTQTGIKLYPDQAQTHDKADGDTLDATREQKIAMIPTRAGNLTLPAIHLTWWDTKTHQQRTSSLPAETIHVLPAAGTSATATPQSPPQAATKATRSIPIKTTPAPSPIVRSSTTVHTNELKTNLVWMILSGFFALAWLITIVLFWSRRKPQKTSLAPISEGQVSEQSRAKHVRLACQNNNPQELKQAVLEWARTHWQNSPPLSLGALATRIAYPAFAAEINSLDKRLYTTGSLDWQAAHFLQRFDEYLKQEGKSEFEDKQDALQPLYPARHHTGRR